MRKLFYYLIDAFGALLFAILGTGSIVLFYILFVPLMAFMVPILIYLSEREKKGIKDYRY